MTLTIPQMQTRHAELIKAGAQSEELETLATYLELVAQFGAEAMQGLCSLEGQ